jgi:hypothetical protein
MAWLGYPLKDRPFLTDTVRGTARRSRFSRVIVPVTFRVLAGMFGYIERSHEVWQIPPETPCIYTNHVIFTKQTSGLNVNTKVGKDLLVLCSGHRGGSEGRQEVTSECVDSA